VRLNKFLSNAGIGSRRAVDVLIASGKVRVDGQLANVGDSVDPAKQIVDVSGRRVTSKPGVELQTLVFHKPKGVVTTMSDERGRRTVADFLPRGPRLFPVGRLDAQTTGLLLCTNDGELANFLLSVRNRIPRVYEVSIAGALSRQAIKDLAAQRVRVADGTSSFSLTLYEGKNRQVRRMCARLGLRVINLTRTQFGPVRLGELRPGHLRPLTRQERSALKDLQRASDH
jgi:23S rRNA pseudouridine2605 synthase